MSLGKAHKGLWSWSRKESQGEHAGIHDNPAKGRARGEGAKAHYKHS